MDVRLKAIVLDVEHNYADALSGLRKIERAAQKYVDWAPVTCGYDEAEGVYVTVEKRRVPVERFFAMARDGKVERGEL